ncbi:hypothetical protein QW131_04440 [Roseibium salinum]|nr:hypothetical protein [Roseibium salinum]
MVIAVDKYIELSNLAVAAAVDPGRWQHFLDEMGQALGTRVFTQLIGYDGLTKAAPLTSSSGYDPDIFAPLRNPFCRQEPVCRQFREMRDRRHHRGA